MGPRWLVLRLLLLLAVAAVNGLHEGDFVATACRSQFHQTRTQWEDLIEHHCPQFGFSRTVAMPIKRPRLAPGAEVKDLKIQLAFDGDSVVTPWITILSKASTSMPFINVELRRVGNELRGAKVKVKPLPDDFLLSHNTLFDEFHNASHWPKHVLLKYTFNVEEAAELDAGLYVVLIFGLMATLAVSVFNLSGLQGKMAQFMRDVMGEDGVVMMQTPADAAAGSKGLQGSVGGAAGYGTAAAVRSVSGTVNQPAALYPSYKRGSGHAD